MICSWKRPSSALNNMTDKGTIDVVEAVARSRALLANGTALSNGNAVMLGEIAVALEKKLGRGAIRVLAAQCGVKARLMKFCVSAYLTDKVRSKNAGPD